MLQKEDICIDGVGMQGHWGLNYPKSAYIDEAIDAYAVCGVNVMITELNVDVLPLTKEGQIIGQGISDKQFQLEEFKHFLDPYRNGLPDSVQQLLTNRYKVLFKIFYSKKDKISRATFWEEHDGMSIKSFLLSEDDKSEKILPAAFPSFLIGLLPVLLITLSVIADSFLQEQLLKKILLFIAK